MAALRVLTVLKCCRHSAAVPIDSSLSRATRSNTSATAFMRYSFSRPSVGISCTILYERADGTIPICDRAYPTVCPTLNLWLDMADPGAACRRRLERAFDLARWGYV